MKMNFKFFISTLKSASIVFGLFLLISLLPLPADALTTITDCAGLQAMAGNLTEDYVLGGDIDCSATSGWNAGAGFIPVDLFAGTFDGQGYTISDLFINKAGNHAGLFARLDNVAGVELKNVNFSNADVTASGWGIGTLLGSNSGNTQVALIDNNHVTNSQVRGTGSNAVGGLVGYAWIGVISNSSFSGDVFGVTDYTGGLIGFFGTSGAYCAVINSFSSGTVQSTSVDVGGLIGWSDCYVINSYSDSSVESTGSKVGGLVGTFRGTNLSGASIIDSYATGAVQGPAEVGGLIGWGTAPTVRKSYATGNVTQIGGAGNNIGGFMGYTNKGTISNSYATGNVTGLRNQIGGFIGLTEGVTPDISDSYSTGAVSGSASVGGFIGLRSAGIITDCFYDITTSLQASGVGTGDGTGVTSKTTAEMTDIDTFTDTATVGLTTAWDFLNNPNNDVANEDIWHHNGVYNSGYPFLRWDWNTAPTHNNPTLAYSGTDLVVTPQNVADAEGNATTTIIDWRVDGDPITILNMPFDTGSDSPFVRDYSSGANHGLLGAGTVANYPTWVDTGRVGGAYDFDGTNDHISLNIPAQTYPSGSLEAWFNAENWAGCPGGRCMIVMLGGGGYAYLGILTSGKLEFLAGGTDILAADQVFNLDEWYHVVGTYDKVSQTQSMYINGVLEKTEPLVNTDFLVSNGTVTIGTANGLDQYFNGLIDEVKIYNRALTPEQIAKNYAKGLAGTASNAIVEEETNIGEVWTAIVTPNDSLADGIAKTSNGVTVAAANITINKAEVNSANTILVTLNNPGHNIASVDFTKWHVDVGDGGATPLTPTSAAITSAGTPWTITLTFAGTPFSNTATQFSADEGLYVDANGLTDTNGDTNVVVGHAASVEIYDLQVPTLAASNIVVNNAVQPNTITLTFSEALENGAGQVEDINNWIVTNNDTSITYDIVSAALGGGGAVVTLTLNSVDSADNTSFITNAAITAGIKVTPDPSLEDGDTNAYAAGTITAAGAANTLDSINATVTAALARTDATTYVVTFSEPVSTTTAETLTNYTLSGTCAASTGNPSGAVIQNNGLEVVLTIPDTSGCNSGGDTVIVTASSTITDVAGVPITSGAATHTLGDTSAPTLAPANIVVNNSVQPNTITLTFSEPLENGASEAETVGNYTVTNNAGSITYDIVSAVLSGGDTIVTLTLNTVDQADTTTFITNAAITAGIKVTPDPVNITDVNANAYDAGEITAAGAVNTLDSTNATVTALLARTDATTYRVTFSEKMDVTTAETLTNYTLSGTCAASVGNPSGAVLQASGLVVILTVPDTSGCNSGGETVIVTPSVDITDVAGVPITSSAATHTLGDTSAPTLAPANIVVNNSVQPNTITLTFSEPLENGASEAETVGNYTVTNNAGSITYDIVSAVLSGGRYYCHFNLKHC
jgi:methionine-rich copper-binding protein CopC